MFVGLLVFPFISALKIFEAMLLDLYKYWVIIVSHEFYHQAMKPISLLSLKVYFVRF